MKDRRPRKQKKLAKKRKAKADAVVIAECSIAQALAMCQLALINSKPIPRFNGILTDYKEEKMLAIANCIIQDSYSANIIMQQIKPWREHV